ncbi:MAG: hypothetical protein GWP08_02400 [Nitrospiraceae bacterium]|nr:hypothetical protein [Nitrospiraceae bacterium]
MSEQTPERLKDFRAQYARNGGGNGKLAVVQLVVTLAGFAAVLAALLYATPRNGSRQASIGLSPNAQREYAVYLEGKQQPEAAIEAYAAYLDAASLTAPERATVCYRVAKLAIDAERYEDALAYLYQAEFLDPESQLRDDINQKVVHCLDKLGRGADLRKELRKRTDVKRSARDVPDGEVVLAEFSGDVVTDRDLELEIEKLPPAARGQFSTPEQKVELLKNIVAQRLLLDKARRLELDKTPEIQEAMVRQLDAMIVNKLITDEVRSKISITPEDVERFFRAEIGRFVEPATAKVVVASAASEHEAKAVTEFGGKPVTAREGGPVPGAPASLDASPAIFAAKAGSVAGPLEADGVWYVFKVIEKTPARTPPFEEVKDQAQRLYRAQKEQESFAALIESTLKTRDVRLYVERIQEPDATP